jgi:hypothetical protein
MGARATGIVIGSSRTRSNLSEDSGEESVGVRFVGSIEAPCGKIFPVTRDHRLRSRPTKNLPRCNQGVLLLVRQEPFDDPRALTRQE